MHGKINPVLHQISICMTGRSSRSLTPESNLTSSKILGDHLVPIAHYHTKVSNKSAFIRLSYQSIHFHNQPADAKSV